MSRLLDETIVVVNNHESRIATLEKEIETLKQLLRRYSADAFLNARNARRS